MARNEALKPRVAIQEQFTGRMITPILEEHVPYAQAIIDLAKEKLLLLPKESDQSGRLEITLPSSGDILDIYLNQKIPHFNPIVTWMWLRDPARKDVAYLRREVDSPNDRGVFYTGTRVEEMPLVVENPNTDLQKERIDPLSILSNAVEEAIEHKTLEDAAAPPEEVVPRDQLIARILAEIEQARGRALTRVFEENVQGPLGNDLGTIIAVSTRDRDTTCFNSMDFHVIPQSPDIRPVSIRSIRGTTGKFFWFGKYEEVIRELGNDLRDVASDPSSRSLNNKLSTTIYG